MSYYRTPFHLVDSLFATPPGSQVYIVSDSEYKAYIQKQALEEIAVLEKRAEHCENTAVSLRETITTLKQEVGLLPESTEDQTTDDD